MTASTRAKVNAKNGGSATLGFGEAFSNAQEETPAPVTVAKGGRGSSGVYAKNSTENFQFGKDFFEAFELNVSPDRMAAYTGENPANATTPLPILHTLANAVLRTSFGYRMRLAIH